MSSSKERCKYLMEEVIQPEAVCTGAHALKLLREFNPIHVELYRLRMLSKEDPLNLDIIRRLANGK